MSADGEVTSLENKIASLEQKILLLENELRNRDQMAKEAKSSTSADKRPEQAGLDFFESNQAVKLLIDYSTGQIVAANKAACDFYMIDRDELLARKIWDINLLGEAATRKQMEMVNRGEKTEFLFDHRLANGEIRKVQVFSGMIQSGSRSLLYSIILDVSRLSRVEADRERLLLAVEQAGEALIITDILGVIQYVNPAFEAITGYSRQEVIGSKPSILKSGKQDLAFYQDLWQTITSGKIWHGKMVNKRKDGTLFTEEATISPARDATGQIVNFVGVKRDMSREIAMEEQYRQAQKMESIGRLAGGVAHDFNNMLGVILCHAEMAMESFKLPGSIADNLKEIVKAAHRSAGLTRQLLAFARKQTVHPETVALNQSIVSMLKMLRRLIGEDIKLVWEPGDDLWSIKIDPAQIDQILANLSVNSRDAIDGVGRITIATRNVRFDEAYCDTHPGHLPGEFVLISISDNGCGMSKDVLEHVFEPFFTTKEEGKGTGLGLATVYGIVKQNSGFLNVISHPGQGTTINIFLPRFFDTGGEKNTDSGAEPPTGSETVLFVEDEGAILRIGKSVLERYGYKVLVAENPEQALIIATRGEWHVDLLVTDVVMPGMNGRELSDRIQAIFPEVKTLFISGYTSNIIQQYGLNDASFQLLRKPFSVKEFALRVGQILHGKVNNDEENE